MNLMCIRQQSQAAPSIKSGESAQTTRLRTIHQIAPHANLRKTVPMAIVCQDKLDAWQKEQWYDIGPAPKYDPKALLMCAEDRNRRKVVKVWLHEEKNVHWTGVYSGVITIAPNKIHMTVGRHSRIIVLVHCNFLTDSHRRDGQQHASCFRLHLGSHTTNFFITWFLFSHSGSLPFFENRVRSAFKNSCIQMP